MERIKQTFEDVKDPRKQCAALDHNFKGALTLVATAMVFGANGPTAIEEYARNGRWHVLRAAGLEKVPVEQKIDEEFLREVCKVLLRTPRWAEARAAVAAEAAAKKPGTNWQATNRGTSPNAE